ncbi:MAG: class II glutamine amidotransferase [Nitriliruptoraceae bacterium]
MCRMAGYVGVPRTLDALLFVPPRSLTEQAHTPREQLHGTVNVDGTGVAWWPDHAAGPLRYATCSPPWADENLIELAPALHARAMIAAVRGATPGVAGGRGAVAPFTVADLAIAHNGWLGGFHEHVAPRLLEDLPAAHLGDLDVLTDSRLLALHIAARRRSGIDLLDTVGETLHHVGEICRALQQPATLNLLVSDGRRLVGARASIGGPCNSLYVLADAEPPWTDGALIASEPLDDRPWEAVPPDHLVEVTPAGTRTVPLGLDAA